jgi:ABC-type transporter Mla maintaining outer membrane lipid asymmetry ATPase subunit MlaF
MEGVAAGSMRDPDLLAIEEINWTVAVGDYWVVAGLQGAGKSDFLMMSAGLMAPVRGCYRFFGEEMPIFEDARLKERLRLGLVFDNGQLFNHLTVRENVALPLRYRDNLSKAEAEPHVRATLERMELEPWADSTPGAIGRNWQKRVGLARALILHPEVLFVDNPLAGLDLRHANWWLRVMGQLSKGEGEPEGRPVTLVVTASDLRPWKGHARQFGILRERRLTVLGPWTQVESAQEELLQELWIGAA